MLTAKQHSEIIQTHWKLLWPLPHRERMRVLDELLADYEYEATLGAISEAVSEPVECASCVITTSPSSLPSSAASSLVA